MNVNFEPFVRYIAKSTYVIPNKAIIARDCRLLYIIKGSGHFESCGNKYPLTAGTLIYYPCGKPYKILPGKENDLLFYTVNFDFSHIHTDILPMAPEEYKGYVPDNLLYTQNEPECDEFENVICLPNSVWCEDELKKICDEGLIKGEAYDTVQSLVLKTVLINIYRHMKTARTNSLIKEIEIMVSQNISFNSKQIAEKLNYHPFYLNSVFKKEKGITLYQYVFGQRLARAHRMLTSTQMTMEEISLTCGFSSQSHLSSAFKKTFGISPAKIRNLV